MSQNEQILSLLRKGPVSPIDALKKAGTLRLAARVHDLKQMGYNIVRENVKKRGKTFAVYHLIEKRMELA